MSPTFASRSPRIRFAAAGSPAASAIRASRFAVRGDAPTASDSATATAAGRPLRASVAIGPHRGRDRRDRRTAAGRRSRRHRRPGTGRGARGPGSASVTSRATCSFWVLAARIAVLGLRATRAMMAGRVVGRAFTSRGRGRSTRAYLAGRHQARQRQPERRQHAAVSQGSHEPDRSTRRRSEAQLHEGGAGHQGPGRPWRHPAGHPHRPALRRHDVGRLLPRPRPARAGHQPRGRVGDAGRPDGGAHGRPRADVPGGPAGASSSSTATSTRRWRRRSSRPSSSCRSPTSRPACAASTTPCPRRSTGASRTC